MTTSSLSGMLYATLPPMEAIENELHRALDLALHMRLSHPFLATIKSAINGITAARENLYDIAAALELSTAHRKPAEPHARPISLGPSGGTCQ